MSSKKAHANSPGRHSAGMCGSPCSPPSCQGGRTCRWTFRGHDVWDQVTRECRAFHRLQAMHHPAGFDAPACCQILMASGCMALVTLVCQHVARRLVKLRAMLVHSMRCTSPKRRLACAKKPLTECERCQSIARSTQSAPTRLARTVAVAMLFLVARTLVRPALGHIWVRATIGGM